MKAPVVYVSFAPGSNGLLAIWLNVVPNATKTQPDPTGWVAGVDQASDYVVERLCELSRVPGGARIVRIEAYAAEWWDKIERARKLAAGKKRRAAMRDAQQLFAIAPEIEEAGRRAARVDAKKRRSA